MRYLHNKPYLLAAAGAGLFLVIQSDSFAVPIDGMTIGGSEKGLYLGVDSTLAPRDLVELGIFYVDATVANIDIGLSSAVPVAVTGGGLRLSYSRFLVNHAKKSGPFVQAGLSAGYLSAASENNLDGLRYSTKSGTVVSCSNCGYLKVKTANPNISFIPSVGIGWQLGLGSRALLRVMGGVQYYSVPSAEWSSSGSLPKFAKAEIKSAIRSLNSDIEGTSDIYPTASLSITYLF